MSQNYKHNFRDAAELKGRIYFRVKGSFNGGDYAAIAVTEEVNCYTVWTQHQGKDGANGHSRLSPIDMLEIHSVKEDALDQAGEIYAGWVRIEGASK